MTTLNPLGLNISSRLRLSEPFCEGLQFGVSQIDRYSVEGYEFIDYTIAAPCSDRSNPYYYEGKVTLYLRVLPGGGGEDEVLLWWGEEDRFQRDILSQVTKAQFSHLFGDGIGTYTRLSEIPSEGLLANCESSGAGSPESNAVRYWAFERDATVPGTNDHYTQYLLVERVEQGPQSGKTFLRRGYTISSDSVQA